MSRSPLAALLRPCLAWTLGLALAVPASARPAPQELDFAAMAQETLAAVGMGEVWPEDFQLAEFLGKTQLIAELGTFEVSMAREKLDEDENVERWIEVNRALLKGQAQYLSWIAPATGLDMKAVEEDVETLEKFLRRLRVGRLQDAAEEAEDFWSAAGAGEEEAAALERLERLLAGGGALGIEREAPAPERIVLTPDRRQFVELASIAGWMVPGNEGVFWHDGVLSWNNFYINEVSVLCLVNPGNTPRDLDTSRPLDEKYTDGLAQQMVQLSANALFDNQFGANIPPSLAQAFAVNLVVDTFGSCSTRVDGDLRERRTEAFERFVAGGNPNGGTLPPEYADNRWRIRQGEDRFTEALIDAQRAGAKEKRGQNGKVRHFELIGENKGRRTVSGPFIGPADDSGTPLPQEFYWEDIEFRRSYRIAFVWWLRDKGPSKGKLNGERFGNLLLELAKGNEGADLFAAIESVYEVPISTPDLEAKSDLEGSFLDWLRRQ